MKLSIGDKHEGYIFVGIIKDYALFCKENDEPGKYEFKDLNDSWPTREELNLMYANKDLIGGFTSDWYWSSTKYTTDYAWVRRISDGNQDYSPNGNNYRVRCVRRIKIKELSIIFEDLK